MPNSGLTLSKYFIFFSCHWTCPFLTVEWEALLAKEKEEEELYPESNRDRFPRRVEEEKFSIWDLNLILFSIKSITAEVLSNQRHLLRVQLLKKAEKDRKKLAKLIQREDYMHSEIKRLKWESRHACLSPKEKAEIEWLCPLMCELYN